MAVITSQQIDKIDKENMRELLVKFPDQWEEAMALTNNLNLTVDKSKINTICLAGMGGSAIGADLVRTFCYEKCAKPIQVVRHYNIPGWVDENTLFITCSYSGNTEETRSAFDQARQKGAQIIVITSGGELLVEASENDIDYIKIPGGLPPRAALGYSFVPLYRVFQGLGFIEKGDLALEDTARLLHRQGDLLADLSESEAASIADDIANTLPVIYSDSTLMEPVNVRWRCQFEENSKTLAYGNTLPEMNHNEIVGWEKITHLTGRLSVILLNDLDDHLKVRQRMKIVKELTEDHAATFHVLQTRGEHPLERMFSLIQLGDWVSFYLAIMNEADPTPVAKIDLLKSKLAEL